MESSVVGAKGHIVIPKKIRAMFRIKQRTRVRFEARDVAIVLTPVTLRYFERMAGFLGTGGKALKVLLEEKSRSARCKWLAFDAYRLTALHRARIRSTVVI